MSGWEWSVRRMAYVYHPTGEWIGYDDCLRMGLPHHCWKLYQMGEIGAASQQFFGILEVLRERGLCNSGPKP